MKSWSLLQQVPNHNFLLRPHIVWVAVQKVPTASPLRPSSTNQAHAMLTFSNNKLLPGHLRTIWPPREPNGRVLRHQKLHQMTICYSRTNLGKDWSWLLPLPQPEKIHTPHPVRCLRMRTGPMLCLNLMMFGQFSLSQKALLLHLADPRCFTMKVPGG